jgi:hypothetical protein
MSRDALQMRARLSVYELEACGGTISAVLALEVRANGIEARDAFPKRGFIPVLLLILACIYKRFFTLKAATD